MKTTCLPSVLLARIKAYVIEHRFEAWIDEDEQAVCFDVPYRMQDGRWGSDMQLVRTFEEARKALGY